MTSATDDFTRNLIAWQNQVIADRGLTLLAFHVAYVIGQHVNRGTGDAWPSQRRLGEILSASRRGVQMAIDQLASRGHLGVTVQRGRNGSNKYRPLLKQAAVEASSDDLNAHHRAHLTATNAHGCAHLDGQGAHEGAHLTDDNVHGGAHQMRTVVRTNYLNEQSEEDSISSSNHDLGSGEGIASLAQREAATQAEAGPKPQRQRNKRSKLDPGQFDEQWDAWWEAYPRKVGKIDARKVFDRLLTSGRVSFDELMAGAKRFAAYRVGKDPERTQYPKTWLNGEHWTDELALPVGSAGSHGPRPHRTSALEYAASRFVDDE